MDYVVVHPAYPVLFLVAVAVSVVITIVATEREWRRGIYVFKPLTTLLIIAVALRQPGVIPDYKTLIVAGLVFSLAGDVLLMLPRDRFVAGLVAFLIAHLLYIAAFADLGFGATWWITLPLAVYAAVLLRILLPRVDGGLKVPVIVYAAALLVMAWQALERGAMAARGGSIGEMLGASGLLAAAGAVLFVASDSALAVNRFVRQFRRADALVLGTYFAAQTLIALSIR